MNTDASIIPAVLSAETLQLAIQALGGLPAGHPQRHAIAIALDELEMALMTATEEGIPES